MKTIIIFDWMIKDLKLSGVELLLYALIHGFSQHDQVCFMLEKTYLDALGCSRAQYYRARSALLSKNLIDEFENGLITRQALKNLDDDELQNMIRIAKTPWLDII